MSIPRKFRNLASDLGLWGASLYGFDRLANRLRLPIRIRSYLIVAQPVPDRPWLSPGRGHQFTLRPIGPSDPALEEMPLDAETRAFRFEQGARCYGLFKGDTLAAYLWFQFGTYREDEVRCDFEPQPDSITAWDFDVYVRPEFRLGRAFLRLWDLANAELAARGIQYSVSRISAFNLASIRSHRRLGATVIGRADFLTLGRMQVLRSNLSPRFHISLGARSRPRVLVSRVVPDGAAPKAEG